MTELPYPLRFLTGEEKPNLSHSRRQGFLNFFETFRGILPTSMILQTLPQLLGQKCGKDTHNVHALGGLEIALIAVSSEPNTWRRRDQSAKLLYSKKCRATSTNGAW